MAKDGVVIECGVLRIEFVWSADRFRHRILASSPGVDCTLASREGKPDETWPPSPALQSLHVEDRPGGVQIAMLVGMAGRSHWSMSVESDAVRHRLLFDVACRVSENPRWLGSSYDIPPTDDGATLGLEIEPMLSASFVFANPQRAVINAPSDSGPLPRTIRWSYAISSPATPNHFGHR